MGLGDGPLDVVVVDVVPAAAERGQLGLGGAVVLDRPDVELDGEPERAMHGNLAGHGVAGLGHAEIHSYSVVGALGMSVGWCRIRAR